jgi:osmoprotectant transport system ATP-binding protein
MGDLVVVMQQGGHIAQASAPAELLAEPASDYVARFVGADRGLKRLSLYRVGDIELERAPLAQLGEDRRKVRDRARDIGQDFVLLVDDRERPVGWIELSDLDRDGRISDADADPMSPLLDRRATLKDATSRLLDEEVRNGVVVDRDGRVQGLLTLRGIISWLQDDRSREVPEDIAEAIAEVVVVDSDGDAPGPP